MERRTFLLSIAIIICLLVLAGCAAGQNPSAHTANAHGEQAGFLLGFWHGMISPITFIVSLFDPSVHFYEVHNNGDAYNFGFVWGAGIIFGSGTSAATRRKRPSGKLDSGTIE